MSTALMGRPRRQEKDGVEYEHIGMRVRSEWAAWFKRLTNHCRSDQAKVIDAALTAYAKAQGFDEPPPPRY